MRGETKRRLGFAITAGVLSLTSEAAVYRCEQGGRTVYTDTPCAAGSEPITECQPTSIAADDWLELVDEERALLLLAERDGDAVGAHADGLRGLPGLARHDRRALDEGRELRVGREQRVAVQAAARLARAWRSMLAANSVIASAKRLMAARQGWRCNPSIRRVPPPTRA